MNIEIYRTVIIRITSVALVLNAVSVLAVHATEKTVRDDAVKVADGSQFFRDLYDYIATFSDYYCRIDVRTFKPQKTVDSDCKFFYKKLNQVRIEAIGGGYRNGSVVVKYEDGTVAGHGGMLLGEMKLKLDADSRLLILPNGLNCTECDYLELLAMIKNKLREGYTCALVTAPGDRKDTDNVLEITAPAASGGNLYAKIIVSNIDRVPSRWELYNSGKLFSVAEFKNIKINTGPFVEFIPYIAEQGESMHALKPVPSQVPISKQRSFILLTAAVVACTAVWLLPQLFQVALASDSMTAEATSAPEKLPKPEELSLNKLQDLGILLRHIKHQAINIYWEASRTKLSPKNPAQIPDIRSIPYVVGNKTNDQSFLPARTQWLVYFFATIEPVARDLGKQVNDINSGRGDIVIPQHLEKLVNPLCDKWTDETEKLNKHLDEMVPLFDDAAHSNIKIRNLAVAIFQDAVEMEKTRTRIYKIVQGEEKKCTGGKILITPALRLDQPLQQ